ncbi:MAG: prenyltransferase/squalene oxidase repeat-containing protein [Planctomycetota bacterium]
MLCPHCGKDTPIDKSYCIHCEQSVLVTGGQQVEPEVTVSESADLGDWGPRLMRWFVGLVVLACVLGFGTRYLKGRPLHEAEIDRPPLPAPRPTLPEPEPPGTLPQAPVIEPVGVSIPPLPQIELAFGSRDERVRRLFLERKGGDAQTEEAVRRGLDWLQSVQDDDGQWGCERFGGMPQHTCGVTGLALLAYLGAGHAHTTDGPYKETVAKALQYILQQQNEKGRFPSSLYTQGICTMALVEAYGMTGDTSLLQQARKAVEFIIAAQQECGGWDYSERKEKNRGDTSVTGWQVMALKSAVRAGIDVPTEVLAKMRQFLRDVTRDGAIGYTNLTTPEKRWRTTPALTAAGLNAHLFAGAEPDDPHVQQAVAILLQNLPELPHRDGENWRPRAKAYLWYHGSLALSRLGGRAWKAWNNNVKLVLLKLQDDDGGWEPHGDRWTKQGGKIYFTSLCLLALEVYYRYD